MNSTIVIFRNMITDPPKKTGRYCVGHRGEIYGHAYYTAREGDTHYPVGWAQVPDFMPEFWLDMGPVDLPDRGPRMPPNPPKPERHRPMPSPKRWWKFWQ